MHILCTAIIFEWLHCAYFPPFNVVRHVHYDAFMLLIVTAIKWCFSIMTVLGWNAFAASFPLGCCLCFSGLRSTETAKSLVILCVGCRGVITTVVLHISLSHKQAPCNTWLHGKLDTFSVIHTVGWHLHFSTHVLISWAKCSLCSHIIVHATCDSKISLLLSRNWLSLWLWVTVLLSLLFSNLDTALKKKQKTSARHNWHFVLVRSQNDHQFLFPVKSILLHKTKGSFTRIQPFVDACILVYLH